MTISAAQYQNQHNLLGRKASPELTLSPPANRKDLHHLISHHCDIITSYHPLNQLGKNSITSFHIVIVSWLL